jgi:para-nitrobenzyl esterase
MRTIPGLEVIGPTHGTELPYVFGTLPTPTTDDDKLSATMQDYWSRFAAAGDPNGAGALDWPAFATATYESMSLDVTNSVVTDYRKAECDFWQTIYAGQF